VREFINPFLNLFRQVAVSIIDFINFIKSFLNKKKIISIKKDINKEILDITNKTKNFYDTNLCLGLYHFYKGNINDAAFRFKTLKLLYKDKPIIYYNLARCFLLSDNITKAKELFEKAIKIGGFEYKEVKFFLDYINGVSVDTLPIFIVKERFDYLAHSYVNNILVGRCYIGHKLILDEVRRFFGKQSFGVSILDLGCGTGVCTHFLRLNNIGSKSVGVDISSNMLAIAKKCIVDNKPIFDELHNQDLTVFLNDNTEKKYDLIIAGDSFGYIGDLQNVISNCKKILTDDGMIVILVGLSKNDTSYEFNIKRTSFLYSESYMKKLEEDTELVCIIKKCKFENMFQGLIGCYTKLKNGTN
jgi:predicted TPR repeat methyltransferase